MPAKASVCVLAMNDEEKIRYALQSARDRAWVDEIVVSIFNQFRCDGRLGCPNRDFHDQEP